MENQTYVFEGTVGYGEKAWRIADYLDIDINTVYNWNTDLFEDMARFVFSRTDW